MLTENYINAVRKLLKESNYLLTLIDAYRGGEEISEQERAYLWVGIYDLSIRLAKRHYGNRKQFVGGKYKWYERADTPHEERQIVRMELIYDFLRQYKAGVSASGVLFALYRRAHQLEIIVDGRLWGIDLIQNKPIPYVTNSALINTLILGNVIYRDLTKELGRTPTNREVLVEYVVKRIESKKMVTWEGLARFANRFFPYIASKNAIYSYQFNEEIGGENSFSNPIY